MKIKLLKLGNEKRQRAEVLTITFSDFDLEQWHKIKGHGQIAISWFLLLFLEKSKSLIKPYFNIKMALNILITF
jgi:hypothetical protein